MELEPGNPNFEPQLDHRVRLPEPLPVRLVAVEDVLLPAPAGVEQELDLFYADMLEFERIIGQLSYRADNFTLQFKVSDGPVVHDSLRPLGVEVMSLADLEKKLIAAELEYVRQRGTTLGSDSMLVLDPAGNWVEISEIRRIL
jgi:hypothetical protein